MLGIFYGKGYTLSQKFGRMALGALLFTGSVFAETITGGGYSANDLGAFNFLDISSSGTKILDPTNGSLDDASAVANIGFSFNFFGNLYSQVNVSTNGLLSFNGVNTDWVNQDLTTSVTSGDLPSIAGYWDDLVLYQSIPNAGIFVQTTGTTGNRVFTVQWHKAGFIDDPTDGSGLEYEIQLFEATGRILMQYQSTSGAVTQADAASATIGIRNTGAPANGQVLQWLANGTGGGGIGRPTTGLGVLVQDVTPSNTITFDPISDAPEPASIALFGLGLAAIGVLRLRKRK